MRWFGQDNLEKRKTRENVSKQKAMQSFTDVSVPCEIRVWATETTEEEATHVGRRIVQSLSGSG